MATFEELEDLRLATIRGNVEKISHLLSKGMSVNQILKGGWSPLLYACSMGHSEIVKDLLKHGADPNLHKELFTPLMAACASTRENEDRLLECVESLIEFGTDVDAVERHRISALMFAAKEGHLKLVAKLVHQEPPHKSCNLDLQDYQGWTALFWAVNQGKSGIVELLVKSGARIDIKDRKGQTCLDLAMGKGLFEIAGILKHKGGYVSPTEPSMISEKADELYEALLIELANIANNNDRVGLEDLQKIIYRMGLEHNINSIKKHEGMRHFWSSIKKKDNLKVKNEINLQPACLPYSLQDAVCVMKNTIKHLHVLYAGTSFVRLRLQGHPLNLPSEYKASTLRSLRNVTKKTIQNAKLLSNELCFLEKHLEKMEENDIIPADVVTQPKQSTYRTTITALCVLAAVSIITLNNLKVLKLPFKLFF